MAKRTNRVAWMTAGVLALVVLIAGLCTRYVVLLLREEWGFGRTSIATDEVIAPDGQRFGVLSPCFKVGLVAILGSSAHTRWPQGFHPVKAGAVRIR